MNRFFDPLTAHNVDVIEKAEQAREFFAYINQNGTLVNEGIVATGAFISMLVGEGAARRLFRAQDGDRGYVAFQLGAAPGSILVGLRKLGLANLKGLDRVPVYEVVDGGQWLDATLVEMRGSRPAGRPASAISSSAAAPPVRCSRCRYFPRAPERSPMRLAPHSGRPSSRAFPAPPGEGPGRLRPR